MACLKLVLNFNCVLGSIHFLEGGVGPRNPGEGHLLFARPEGEGQHKFDTTKRWVTINFTASRGRVTFFNKKYKGRAGRFYIHAHRDSSSPPMPPLLKNECSQFATYTMDKLFLCICCRLNLISGQND